MIGVRGMFAVRCVAFAAGLFLLTAAGAARLRADDAPDEKLNDDLLKLNALTGVDAMQGKINDILKDKPKAGVLVATGAKMLKDAKGKEPPLNYNACLILAKTAHVLKKYDHAERFYEACAESATKLSSANKILQAYEGMMDLYWENKKFNAVEEVCQKLMELKGGKELENAKPFVLEKLIQAKAKQGNTDEALKMADTLVQLDDGGWYFVKLKAWVQQEAGKTDDAITTYKDARDKLDKSKLPDDAKGRQKDTITYILSGLYVDSKQIEKAAEQLQTLVKNHPDNPTFKNDLGFIWADHDLNLDESEKLIRDALKQDKELKTKLKDEGKLDEVKDNAAYLDSLGWVLFKQKKYKDALKYLKDAITDPDEGQHLEIYDHLADVYVALGQKAEAVKTWEKALKLEDVSRRDAERRRKVTDKLKKYRAEVQKD